MSETPLTKDAQLKIAAEVMEGKRPQSDTEKYGLSFGETIEGDEAKQMLINELKTLGFNMDDEDDSPADPAAG